MPTPRKGEKEKDFIARCVPILIEEGKPSDQAVAQCHSIWDSSKKKKKK